MADFENLINELIELEGKDEPNFENFDIAIDNLNRIILKINNMENICKKKIIFLGRCGSMKNKLILNLIKLKLSPDSLSKIKNKYIEYISENNKYGILVDDKTEPIEFESVESLDEYIQSNYSTFSSHIKIFYPRSENEILKDKIMIDTPFYDYSDKIDDEIVNNCRDGHIFIVVLNAVGSIGYKDEKFLKRISEINFIKLIFIFNCMEQIKKENYDRTKSQHETNAIRISNEILIPPQENIPIFFIENCQLNKDNLQSLCFERDLNDYAVMIVKEINQAKELITTKKREIMETKNEKEKEFDDYEEQRKSADEQNIRNEIKNKHQENLQKMIENIIYAENKIRKHFEKSININEILDYLNQFEKFNNTGNENLQVFRFKEADEPDEQKIHGEIVSHDDEKTKNQRKKSKIPKTAKEETDEKEILGKVLCDQILQKIESRSVIDKKLKDDIIKFIDNYNKLLKQISNDNERNQMNAKEKISKHIKKILQNIGNIFKSDSPFREMFEFSENMLNNLNAIWKNNSVEIENIKTSTFPELLDHLIKEIESVEIESFQYLLLFVLLIKLLLEMISIEINNKVSSSSIKKTEITQTNKLNELNEISENIKSFDKIYQITFPKYEITTKFSESESNSIKAIILQNKNKLEILEKVENRFDEKLKKIIEKKIILIN